MKNKPIRLRCEYEKNPIGVQTIAPLLSWQFQSTRNGARQQAYRIVAASCAQKMLLSQYDCWDTGKVKSDAFFAIRYEGEALSSGKRVYWQVQIWEENGTVSSWSEPAFFEMGLLFPTDWKGRWMGFLGGLIGNGLVMRYSFQVQQGVVQARAYIAGLGYYELHLNGKKVGDKLLDPGATDTSKTVLYSAYDVTDQLHDGLNVIGIVLGTGWSGTPKALLQLNLELADGSMQQEYTDWGIGWCVAKGPIVYNSIYDGEDYDARLEKDGWCTPAYEKQFQLEHQRQNGWILGTIIEPPGGELVGEISAPIRVTGVIAPIEVGILSDGRKLYDAAINRSGWVRMKVHGERGSQVKITFAEQLNDEGGLDFSYMRMARAQDCYILRGDRDVEEYAPRFTYHGFRYFTVEIVGEAVVDELVAEFVRSDLPRNAVFSCNEPFLNHLAEVMWNTDASNLHSIPSDCCQRDERHGWTTDTTARVEGCTYHFDMASFFEKWTRDVFDTQDENGYVADTAPHRWGRRPCDPQVNTPICLPLLLYHTYGNKRILEQYYEDMKRYLEALLREAEDYLVLRTGFGEWACPRSECYPEPFGAGAVSRHVTPMLVSTAYLYRSAEQISEIAGILQKEAEVQELKLLCKAIRARYNMRFFDATTGQYDTGSQSSNALSLHLGLVEDANIVQVVQRIVEDVERHDDHMTTGNMGTKALVEVLCEHGQEDVVYRLFTQRTSPSFGYMLEQGATSMWERWEADKDNNIMNSHNHPMLSSACTLFYKYLGGIQVAQDGVGFQKMVIHPSVPTQLQWVHTEMTIQAGLVRTAWKKEAGDFFLSILLPFNTSAVVVIPKKAAPKGKQLYGIEVDGVCGVVENETAYRVSVQSGKYEFILSSKDALSEKK